MRTTQELKAALKALEVKPLIIGIDPGHAPDVAVMIEVSNDLASGEPVIRRMTPLQPDPAPVVKTSRRRKAAP